MAACYGNQQEQSLFNINISNVTTNTRNGIWIPGGLTNSNISHVIARSPDVPTVKALRPDLLVDVIQTGVHMG